MVPSAPWRSVALADGAARCFQPVVEPTPPWQWAGAVAMSRVSSTSTLTQAESLLQAAEGPTMGAYAVLPLLTGAFRGAAWPHLGARRSRDDVGATPPVPPHIMAWRSVRVGGDMKTRKSRAPSPCHNVACSRCASSAPARTWPGTSPGPAGITLTSSSPPNVGTPSTPPTRARRSFRRIAAAAGLTAADRTPRELRHSFVSQLSDSGAPSEQIHRLVGHSGTSVTEIIYRKQIRPCLDAGVTAMDRISSFAGVVTQ
jgi:hypothetical protein